METNLKEQLKDILSYYNKSRDNLIPVLQEVQRVFGYLPEKAMQEIADFLRLSNSTVYAVATFYAQLRLTPPGKKTITVCRGPACHLRGSAVISNEIEKRLGIKPGETTGDFKYSLETTSCSGACAQAPVVEIDDKVYGQMTKESLNNVLANKQTH
jgi:NADH-quinone oxidoreductase subunit E